MLPGSREVLLRCRVAPGLRHSFGQFLQCTEIGRDLFIPPGQHALEHILQALGAAPTVNVEVDMLGLRDMDIVLLCSDGLSNKVRTDEMKQLVDDSPSLKEACESLVTLANERGGEDNITVMIAQFAGGGLPGPERRSVSFTAGLIADSSMLDRWGAEGIPRDPDLPYEIESRLVDDVDDEEDTIVPTDKLKLPE